MYEIWRSATGYTGLYMVSNTGKVKSVRTGHILKPYVDSGYNKVTLCSVERRNVKVAKLVATAFVPNPFNYKYVSHVDLDKLHDHANNLVWSKYKAAAEHASGKAVIVTNLFGNPLSVHASVTDAADFYDYTPQLVSKRCSTKTPTRTGLYFNYFEGSV